MSWVLFLRSDISIFLEAGVTNRTSYDVIIIIILQNLFFFQQSCKLKYKPHWFVLIFWSNQIYIEMFFHTSSLDSTLLRDCLFC